MGFYAICHCDTTLAKRFLRTVIIVKRHGNAYRLDTGSVYNGMYDKSLCYNSNDTIRPNRQDADRSDTRAYVS